MKKYMFLAVMVVALVTLSMQVSAQIKKGKTRVVTTKQLMAGLVQPNCAAIGAISKAAPADDKAWAALATNAALLNEISYNLMEDGRCPDSTWANAVKTLQTGSAAVLAKIEAKDAAGVAAEFKTMTASCAACHKAHKK